jgi:hypothetical protein
MLRYWLQTPFQIAARLRSDSEVIRLGHAAVTGVGVAFQTRRGVAKVPLLMTAGGFNHPLFFIYQAPQHKKSMKTTFRKP